MKIERATNFGGYHKTDEQLRLVWAAGQTRALALFGHVSAGTEPDADVARKRRAAIRAARQRRGGTRTTGHQSSVGKGM